MVGLFCRFQKNNNISIRKWGIPTDLHWVLGNLEIQYFEKGVKSRVLRGLYVYRLTSASVIAA